MTTSKPIDTTEVRTLTGLIKNEDHIIQCDFMERTINQLCDALDALRARIVELEKVSQAAVGTTDLRRDLESGDWLEG